MFLVNLIGFFLLIKGTGYELATELMYYIKEGFISCKLIFFKKKILIFFSCHPIVNLIYFFLYPAHAILVMLCFKFIRKAINKVTKSKKKLSFIGYFLYNFCSFLLQLNHTLLYIPLIIFNFGIMFVVFRSLTIMSAIRYNYLSTYIIIRSSLFGLLTIVLIFFSVAVFRLYKYLKIISKQVDIPNPQFLIQGQSPRGYATAPVQQQPEYAPYVIITHNRNPYGHLNQSINAKDQPQSTFNFEKNINEKY